MTDILFIFPSLTVEERYGRRGLGNVGGDLPPLGIAQIASYMEAQGFSVGLIDAVALGMDMDDVVVEIGRRRPKAIGLSALTPTFHRAVSLAGAIRERFPDIMIVLGGHHATLLPAEVLDGHPAIDIVVRGEGEITIGEVMEHYRSHRFSPRDFLGDFTLLEDLPGIGYRGKDGSSRLTVERKPITDLDTLPLPARHLLPMNRYLPLPNQYKQKPVVHTVFIRGCPFQCSFCSNPAIYGRHVRFKSPGRAVEEIVHVAEKYGARELSFWDDTFTVNRKWLEDLCERLVGKNLGITWSCYASVNTVDPEILRLMKRAGCWNIFYGFESGNQKLLDMISKGISLDDIRQAALWTHEAGIEMRASFMIALPGETPDMARETLAFALELEPEYVQFSFTTPFPGTRLYEDARSYGRLNHGFPDYYGWTPVFVPFGYKDEKEIMKMHRWMTRRFYLRPAYIFKMLKKVRTLEDLRRYLKGLKVAARFSL